MNLVPSIVSPVSDGARPGDARAARPLGPIIDLDPVHGYAASESRARAFRAYQQPGERPDGSASRHQRWTRAEESRPAPSLGFTAQQIAQEVLSDGLYFENYRPALAAYAAAGSNFAHVRQPPPSTMVVWA